MTSGRTNFNSWMAVQSKSRFQAGSLKKGSDWQKRTTTPEWGNWRGPVMCKTKLSIADNHPTWWAAGHSAQVSQRWSAFLCHSPSPLIETSSQDDQHPVMSLLLIAVLSSLLVQDVGAWGANVKYAVNCPDRCNAERCGGTQRCTRTVLDDCGCCQVCAAGRGEHCYRTVSGMHGVKCGPGLFCEFYKDEDDYGDEYGVCKGVLTFSVIVCI